MKQPTLRLLACTLMLLYATAAFGQASPSPDSYAKARGILEDAEKIVAPNGVQEAYETVIGGVKQWVYVRGQDKNNPLLLFVHGGPARRVALARLIAAIAAHPAGQ